GDRFPCRCCFSHRRPLRIWCCSPGAPRSGHPSGGVSCTRDLGPITPTALCVDVKGPGLLVVKGMLRNVMIYHAGEATFLEDEDYNTLVRLTRLALPGDAPGGDRFVNAYWTTRVVDSMRKTGHGGIVLLVPNGSSDWRGALSDAPKYQCSPPF